MIILIDNYDSFTYNLFDYLQQLNKQRGHDSEVLVVRNDRISVQEILSAGARAIVISPGPQRPEMAGNTMQIIEHLHQVIPIFGVCLGFQGIGQFFGARLVRAPLPVHGKTSLIYHNNDALFENIPNPFQAMRYHSLCLENIPDGDFIVTAWTADHIPMAFRHRYYPLCGVQFHPESILTTEGMQILRNWKKQYWSAQKTG
jgi:anthranilate synthase component 2